ncbi:MAG TPA: DUF2934 domain-containing protein [Bryobacteraceae bacterium]|nr:DUF2934 domain-containing protein [Bryobacteraceae bacterium]
MAAQPSPFSRKQQRRRNEQAAQPAQSVIPREEQIRQRAYEIYLQRGELPGSEIEDWLQAESEVADTKEK